MDTTRHERESIIYNAAYVQALYYKGISRLVFFLKTHFLWAFQKLRRIGASLTSGRMMFQSVDVTAENLTP